MLDRATQALRIRASPQCQSPQRDPAPAQSLKRIAPAAAGLRGDPGCDTLSGVVDGVAKTSSALPDRNPIRVAPWGPRRVRLPRVYGAHWQQCAELLPEACSGSGRRTSQQRLWDTVHPHASIMLRQCTSLL